MADSVNNRVLVYAAPFSTGESATLVLGQANFTSGSAGLSATAMQHPFAIAEDSSGNFWVADRGNSRVLEFKPPFSTGMSASLVIGQPNFVTGNQNTTQNGLMFPASVAFDSSGNLWVVDTGNNRVLQYQPPFANGMNASLVIGQESFTSSQQGATTSSAFEGPWWIALDSTGNLWVVDEGNNRVLEFQPPFANGMSASLVIGQTDFTSGSSATTASNLSSPYAGAFDSSGNLWIADSGNNRIVQFKPPFSTGISASLVLGQPNFTSDTWGTTQNTLNTLDGSWLAFDGSGNLWVADDDNNRTLEFTPPFSTQQDAALVLGQANFTSDTTATTATGQWFPAGIIAF